MFPLSATIREALCWGDANFNIPGTTPYRSDLTGGSLMDRRSYLRRQSSFGVKRSEPHGTTLSSGRATTAVCSLDEAQRNPGIQCHD